MAKINLTTTLKNEDKKPLFIFEEDKIHGKYNEIINGILVKCKKVNVTLKSVCINALFTMTENDRMLDGNKKLELYDLAMRIKKTDEIILTSDEIVLIKNRIGNLYSPIYVGRAFELLESKGSK